MISQELYRKIFLILIEEYTIEATIKMLDGAVFFESARSIFVTYSNGAVDVFRKMTTITLTLELEE